MTNDNPWLVDSLQDFWFLKCPECTFDTQEDQVFQDHAVENHPQSLTFFHKKVKEELIDNNFVDCTNFTENNYDDNSSETALYPQILPIVQIKEELLETNFSHPAFEPQKKKLFECSICKKSYGRRMTLKRHIEEVHEGKKPIQIPQTCPTCNKTLKSEKILRRHIERVHEGVKLDEPINCPECDLKFISKLDLKQHTKAVHDKDKPSICSKCDISFDSKLDLKQHTKDVHTEVKTYPCSECDSNFTSKYLQGISLQSEQSNLALLRI